MYMNKSTAADFNALLLDLATCKTLLLVFTSQNK